MLTDIQELIVFQAVAKHASYARAAEELGLSPSGVSRVVTRLEERLGARLVQRTTRKLCLTEAGVAFHARTSQVLADLADAEAEVQQTVARPKGTLKVTASVMFGQLYLAPLLPELLEYFPELSVEMVLTNRFVDLIEEGIDLAIRIGSLADSRLVARRLCTNRRVLVASPGYLERSGTPEDRRRAVPPPLRAVHGVRAPERVEADRTGRPGHACRSAAGSRPTTSRR